MRVLLIGHPVAHSLSPVLQAAAFAASGLDHQYELADTGVAALPTRLRGLRDGHHLGANVTIPHKVAAVAEVDRVDADVRELGALNTIVVTGHTLSGHNTDVEGAWEGLLAPVQAHLAGARVVLLGAGGGARAVLLALARMPPDGPAEVLIAARRPAAGAGLAALGDGFGLRCRGVPWWDLQGVVAAATVLVNCTPVGLEGGDPLAGIDLGGRVVLDLAYRPGGTPLVRRARVEAAAAAQGDEMLLRQGAAAFRLWTGLEAPIEAMRRALAGAIG